METLNKTAWKESLQLGISSIDSDHKHLVAIFDALSDSMQYGITSQSFGLVIDELKVYTQTHFANEEQLMSQTNYPAIKKHIEEHQYFVKKIADFEASCKSGRVIMSVDLLVFLKDWILNHIRKTDAEYVPHLLKNGITHEA